MLLECQHQWYQTRSSLNPMETKSSLLNHFTANALQIPVEKDSIITYQSVVGSLMYTIICTRLDLVFTLSRLSKFNANPTNIHIAAAYHALRYLRQTSTVGIVYRRTENSELYAFSDSDFAADPIDRKSTSGFVTIHNGGAISWRSKQQDVVALSTTEAEYIGLSDACRELNWLVPLAQNSGMFRPTESYVPTIYGDNQGSIALATNPIHHNRSKHRRDEGPTSRRAQPVSLT